MREVKKEWINFDDLIMPYEREGYTTVFVGVVDVDPSQIIGLSIWPPNKVYNDSKMDNLIERIEEEGWLDKSPRDIDVVRFPNGQYSICEGGNHRALYSREMEIPRIQASVSILIPNEEISSEILKWQEEKSARVQRLNKEFRRVQRVIDKNGHNAEELPEWVEYDEIARKLDDLDEQDNEMLREEARRLGYL